MDLKALVGRRIAELRSARGMTHHQVAKAVGVTAQFVWRLESGERAPSFDVLAKLAGALDVEPVEFFRDSDDGSGKKKAGKPPIALAHLSGAAQRLNGDDLQLVLALAQRLGKESR